MSKLLWTAVGCLLTTLALAAPDIQHWETTSGARVYFIPTDNLPIVDARVVFDAGSARDGQQPGLALLANRLLRYGAGHWSANDVAAALDGVGAELGTHAQRDMAAVSLRSLTDPDKLRTAVQMANAVIVKPRFAPQDLARERAQQQTAIRAKQQNPGAIARDLFFRAVYGAHPYGHPVEGTQASVAAITREDVEAFHANYYTTTNAVVAIVGDLSRAEAERLAANLLDGLPVGSAAAPVPPVGEVAAAERAGQHMPTAQTHILIGEPGMSRDDEHYYPLYVGNHILGGSGFASRLMQVIREDRGLAYSVYSYFQPMAQKGPLQIGMQTRNEQVPLALELLRDNVQRFIEEGPTDEELDKAISNITGGFPLNIDSNSDLVSQLAMIGFYRLPLDYLERYSERIRAVTAEQIRAAFQRRLDVDAMATVLVGGAAEPRE